MSAEEAPTTRAPLGAPGSSGGVGSVAPGVAPSRSLSPAARSPTSRSAPDVLHAPRPGNMRARNSEEPSLERKRARRNNCARADETTPQSETSRAPARGLQLVDAEGVPAVLTYLRRQSVTPSQLSCDSTEGQAGQPVLRCADPGSEAEARRAVTAAGGDLLVDGSADSQLGAATPPENRDWEMWECAAMRDLREEGDGLNIQRDVLNSEPTVRDEMVQFRAAVQQQYEHWATYAAEVADGILVTHMASEASVGDWKSLLFRTKLQCVVLLDDVRAHPEGAYEKTNGAWQRITDFSKANVARMEGACKKAVHILLAGSRGEMSSEARQAWGLPAYIAALVDSGAMAAHHAVSGSNHDSTIDDAKVKNWSAATAGLLRSLIPVWSTQNELNFDRFCKWAYAPRAAPNGQVAFADCLLQFSAAGIEQHPKIAATDCYTFIPHSLAYTPSEDFQCWFRRFFVTTVAGNADAMKVEFAIEALALLGLRLPHHILIYYGAGGNAKGARSRLRSRVFGSGHKWVPPQVFDVSLKDEFRKQGTDFYRALICTVREADAFTLDEKVFRTWTAGEGLACRLPYARTTPMLEWETTGKFWEMNVKSTPVVRSLCEASFRRRIIGVEKDATFSSDVTKVDAANKIFPLDENLEEKLDTGDAVWCYYRQYLLPFIRKCAPSEARALIANPPDAVRSQTTKLLNILRANQGEGSADDDAPSISTKSASSKLLLRCHEAWASSSIVKEYQIRNAAWIPGAKKESPGKRARIDVFRDALTDVGNFFFRQSSPTEYERSPFEWRAFFLAVQNADVYGTVASWRPFTAVPSVCPIATDQRDATPTARFAGSRGASTTIEEVADIAALRSYHALSIDRRPAILAKYISRVEREGVRIDENFFAVEVTYATPDDLPNRQYAIGPSLQTLTKEARSVAVRGRCRDLDFPHSYVSRLFELLSDCDAIAKFPAIHRFYEHHSAWRALWGKKSLLALMFGGIPAGSRWNPCTWTLALEIEAAAKELLQTASFEHLNTRLCDRRRPMYSRLSYALGAAENAKLMEARASLAAMGIRARCLLFDGLLVEGAGPVGQWPLGLVEKPLVSWAANFFLLLRNACSPLPLQLTKSCDRGKRMCLPASLLNVGNQRTATAMRSLQKCGPYTYMAMAKFLVSKRTGQYLNEASVSDIEMAPVGAAFLIHCDGHCVGATVSCDGIILADSKYPTMGLIKACDLSALCASGSGDDAAAQFGVAVFSVSNLRGEGPAKYGAAFHLCAAGSPEAASPSNSDSDSGADATSALLPKMLLLEVADELTALQGRSQYGSQQNGYKCNLCVCKVFDRKSWLREHVAQVHQSRAHGFVSRKQLRVAKALHNERQADLAASEFLSGGPGDMASEAQPMFIRRSAAILREWLSASPSFAAVGTGRVNWDNITSWAYTEDGCRAFIRRDAESLGYTRLGDTYYTESFLKLLLAWCMDPLSKCACRRVRTLMAKHYLANGCRAPYMLMSLGTLRRAIAAVVDGSAIVAQGKKRLGEMGDFAAVAVDGTFKYLLSVKGQSKHGHPAQSSPSGQSAEIHVVLTYRSKSGCVFAARPVCSESGNAVVASLAASLEGYEGHLRFLYTDSPAMHDTLGIRASFPNLEAIGDDPLHRPFEIATYFGDSMKAEMASQLRRIHLKFVATLGHAASAWIQGPGYYARSICRASLTSKEAQFLAKKPPRLSMARARALLDAVDPDHVFASRLEYMMLVEALAVKHAELLGRRNKKRSLRETLASAMNIERMEYLANGCRWRARNNVLRENMACGTTGNEGNHFELKSWGRNVMTQKSDRARTVLDCFVASKILAFVSCAQYPMSPTAGQDEYLARVLTAWATPKFRAKADSVDFQLCPARRSLTSEELCSPSIPRAVRAKAVSSNVKQVRLKKRTTFANVFKKKSEVVRF